MWKKRVRVGDLVKCEFNGDDIGVIIKGNDLGFYVWINNKSIIFFRNQLEVICESR